MAKAKRVKGNMKKLKIFQLTIIVLFAIFIFFFFKPVDYTKEYVVDEIKINESYDKDNDYYYFTLTYNDYTLDYLYESNYKHNRTFIESIEIIEDDDNFCLIPSGNTIEFIPLCVDNDSITYYKKVTERLLENIPEEYLQEEKERNESVDDITIYNDSYTYLLWDYNGFYYISGDTRKKIDLFDTETYNANLITYTKDYLVVADYDAEYTFNKFYRIDLKNGNVKEFNLDRNIYFDSYFPGYEKNKLYIVDNKEETMYELNVKNGKLERINAKMLYSDEWNSVGIKTLINSSKKFTYKSNYEYELNEGVLALKYTNKDITTKIDDEVTYIVRIKDNLIFYLKTDTLYVFDPIKGSTRLLNNFEWNFNFENMIYVN